MSIFTLPLIALVGYNHGESVGKKIIRLIVHIFILHSLFFIQIKDGWYSREVKIGHALVSFVCFTSLLMICCSWPIIITTTTVCFFESLD